jgi:phage baseplate assembly protein W
MDIEDVRSDEALWAAMLLERVEAWEASVQKALDAVEPRIRLVWVNPEMEE